MYAYIDPSLWRKFYKKNILGTGNGTAGQIELFLKVVGTNSIVSSLKDQPRVVHYWPIPKNAGLCIRFYQRDLLPLRS